MGLIFTEGYLAQIERYRSLLSRVDKAILSTNSEEVLFLLREFQRMLLAELNAHSKRIADETSTATYP